MAAIRDTLLELVALAYEAALEPMLWSQVAAGASRAFEAPRVMLGVVDRRGNLVMDAEPPGWSISLGMAPYRTAETNPALAFAAVTPPATVELRERIISDSDLERSQIYQELMRPIDTWHGAVMNVHRDSDVLAPMTFLRRRKQSPFDDGHLDAMRALAPHFNRALRVTVRLREMEARANALAEVSNGTLTALLITDACGRVAEANGLARAILEENDGLTIRNGLLRAARGDDNARLARLILEAAGSVDGFACTRKSGVIEVARPSCRRSLALVVSPTRNAASPFGRSHAVSVSFADPERGPEVDADLLARLYGLTAREAAVAALLVQGRSPTEVAQDLAMGENTVRTHIRRALEKTGAERLADLVRLLVKGPGVRGR
ncbi:MAG: helix-turn-helix transcriptional regulator [Hyphomicrobiales bacterium]|nr:helix-turn-helix transcriptional regulator [Hyphomicrobiales bacterium]